MNEDLSLCKNKIDEDFGYDLFHVDCNNVFESMIEHLIQAKNRKKRRPSKPSNHIHFNRHSFDDIKKCYYQVSSVDKDNVRVKTILIFTDGMKSIVSQTFKVTDKDNIHIDKNMSVSNCTPTDDCKFVGMFYALLKANLGMGCNKDNVITGNGFIRKYSTFINNISKTIPATVQ